MLVSEVAQFGSPNSFKVLSYGRPLRNRDCNRP
nr:MAG TPA: hypothetical protein [Bacteriophage sp.]